jgi:uncharacterized protein YlxW (UPF0749 family)
MAVDGQLELPSVSGQPARRPSSKHGTITVGLVAALAGALFATNAALFRTGGERHPQNLAELVTVESARTNDLAVEVTALREQVADLIERERGRGEAEDPPAGLDVASARVPVVGTGVVVQLWDAPSANAPEGARPDDLVVHQQDLEAVMNALWAGGAEAMTIQGNRVTSRTAVRCVGSVLLMGTRTYSPPYEVAVVGDPDDLLAALDASPEVQIYRQYVDVLGLGWSVQRRDRIEMPADEGTQGLQYAVVAAGASATSDPSLDNTREPT